MYCAAFFVRDRARVFTIEFRFSARSGVIRWLPVLSSHHLPSARLRGIGANLKLHEGVKAVSAWVVRLCARLSVANGSSQQSGHYLHAMAHHPA